MAETDVSRGARWENFILTESLEEIIPVNRQ